MPSVSAPRVAERVRRIKPSPSTAAADRANQLRREGRSVVNLVVGEPDFDTPRPIRQAAARAMEDGATRYTALAGTLDLRRAIAAKLTTPAGDRLETDADVVLYLLEQAGVAVVAGAAYGLSPYFRLSVATSLDTLRDGVARMARAVADLS